MLHSDFVKSYFAKMIFLCGYLVASQKNSNFALAFVSNYSTQSI